MSISRIESGPGGKDVVLLAAPALLAEPSRVTLAEPEPAPGLILPDGSINWGCPCLGGMATGPCAQPFRDAFSCFHYSEAEPKGSDCYEKFSDMQACMAGYPELYGRDDDDEPALPGVGGAEPDPDRDRDRDHDPRDRDRDHDHDHDPRDRDHAPAEHATPASAAAERAQP